MNELITVCMCAYNAEKYIGSAIESVLKQTYPHFKLFVVNDASTDGTLEIAKQYTSDPRVTVIDMHENVGTYSAKNLVLDKFSVGEYWAHHDADDESFPERFEKELAYLKENNLDGCGSAVNEVYIDGLAPRIPSDDPLVYDEKNGYHIRRNIYPLRVTKENVSIDVEDLPKLKIMMNGTPIFKLAAVKDMGGFDGETRFGADSDFMWRFVKFYSFGNIQEVLYTRRFHMNSLTQRPETNHSSPARKIYAEKILKQHFEALEAYDRGEMDLAKKLSTQNMYYPVNVSYTVFQNESKEL